MSARRQKPRARDPSGRWDTGSSKNHEVLHWVSCRVADRAGIPPSTERLGGDRTPGEPSISASPVAFFECHVAPDAEIPYIGAVCLTSMSIMHPVLRLKVPGEISRLAAVVVMAGLVATAAIYSRKENAAEDTEHDSKQALRQPADRQQAEGWFTPTPRVAELPEKSKIQEVASLFPSSPPMPRARPITPGFYYELVRAQGDAEEGDYVLVARRCIPKIDMPRPCYLPENTRRNFPLRRE